MILPYGTPDERVSPAELLPQWHDTGELEIDNRVELILDLVIAERRARRQYFFEIRAILPFYLDEFLFEEDGSLIIHLQAESPGAEREINWLPAPNGPFYAVLRLYLPKASALNGKWTPPMLSNSD